MNSGEFTVFPTFSAATVIGMIAERLAPDSL